MAKKAKLDILEITIDEKSEDKLSDEIILEEKKDTGSDEKQADVAVYCQSLKDGCESPFSGSC